MEHPLIGDISSLTVDELGAKVSELQKKLGIAQRSGNGHLSNQIRMALETYYNAYQAKLQETYQKQNTSNIDFNDKINIQ
jgi:hypothetical protein